MQRIAILFLLVLIACTGTREAGVPTLLVVAAGGTDGTLLLIEDTLSSFPEVRPENRFVLLTEQSLNGEALAYDIVDLRGDRRELAVLVKEEDSYAVRFFNLAGIDPDDPVAFEETRFLGLDALYEEDILPVDVQVSESGRYVALLNNFASAAVQNTVDVIDTRDTPRLLQRFENSVTGSSLFLDQDEARGERIYYLSEQTNTELHYITLPELDDVDTNLVVPNSISTANRVRDIGKGREQLIALQPSQFVPVTLGATPNVEQAVTTSVNSQKLVPNNSVLIEELLILTNSQLTVHRSVDDTSPQTGNLEAVDGSLEPVGGFAYFVKEDAPHLAVFDLQLYRGDASSSVESRLFVRNLFETEEEPDTVPLSSPVFISWVKAVPAVTLLER